MSRRHLAALGLAVALACACGKRAPSEEPKDGLAASATASRFYYDLGPATVDVSVYPPRQQEGYKVFLAVCGTCHTTARPLNSPYAAEASWRRYVRRMHGKMESRAILPSAEDEARILDFLVYDSKVRKLDNAERFQADQDKLKKLFEKHPVIP